MQAAEDRPAVRARRKAGSAVGNAVDYSAVYHKTFRPGDEVEASGVYRVTHDSAREHEVTMVHGTRFPPCRHCGIHCRFVAVRLAQHVASNEHFH